MFIQTAQTPWFRNLLRWFLGFTAEDFLGLDRILDGQTRSTNQRGFADYDGETAHQRHDMASASAEERRYVLGVSMARFHLIPRVWACVHELLHLARHINDATPFPTDLYSQLRVLVEEVIVWSLTLCWSFASALVLLMVVVAILSFVSASVIEWTLILASLGWAGFGWSALVLLVWLFLWLLLAERRSNGQRLRGPEKPQTR